MANVDPGHTVGVSNPDQEDPTSLPLRPPGLAFRRHPQSHRNPPSELQARRLFQAYLLKGRESGPSELHPIGWEQVWFFFSKKLKIPELAFFAINPPVGVGWWVVLWSTPALEVRDYKPGRIRERWFISERQSSQRISTGFLKDARPHGN